MGRVFSYEAVAAGRVPQPEDFVGASKAFGEQIQEGVDAGAIDGGFIFGSSARGTATIRSDFDTFIAPSDGSIRSYEVARNIAQSIFRSYDGKILIEPIVYPKPTLATGAHELDRMFGEHLTGDIRQVTGNDPAEYMKFADDSMYAIMTDYLFHRLRMLTNSYVMADMETLKDNGLQRMLEMPNSMGRRVLQAMVEVGHVEYATEASDKPTIFRHSEQVFQDHGLGEGFRTLTALNNEYTEVLQQAVNGEIGEKIYNDEIRSIHSKMPIAIEWARDVGATILPMLDRK